MSPRRIVFLPSVGLAIVLVVVVYQIRMRTNRPDVPLPVSATLEHFAPGLAIGATLQEARAHLAASEWRSGLGYVGAARTTEFSHALLLPSLADRTKATPDDGARVAVVELMADTKTSMVNVMSDLSIAFRGIPRMGCIARVDGRHDEVQYWTSRRDLGGVAVITAWGGDSVVPSTVYTWSLVAWAGPFKGSETLTAPFDPRPCDGGNAAVTSAAIDASIALREQTQTELLGALREAAGEKAAVAHAEITNADAPSACDVPAPTGSRITRFDLYGFTIELPDDFVLDKREHAEAEARRTGIAHYLWWGSDRSKVTVDVLWPSSPHLAVLGRITDECDANVFGHDVHFDIGNASSYAPLLTVGAAYKSSQYLPLHFVGVATSQARQRELLRAAHFIQLNDRWGKKEGDP